MSFAKKTRLAWSIFSSKESADETDPIGYIAFRIGEAERTSVRQTMLVLADIKAIISRCETSSGNTWKELHMALADIINAAAAQIEANTTAFAAAQTAAVTSATASLTDQVSTLTTANQGLQSELDAATAAIPSLQTAVAAQSAAAGTPPSAPAA